MMEDVIYSCPNIGICGTFGAVGKCSKACIERYNKEMGIKPKTNADRIRAMSDREVATDLLDMFEEICEDGVPSKEWMLHWLQQPAEGDCV